MSSIPGLDVDIATPNNEAEKPPKEENANSDSVVLVENSEKQEGKTEDKIEEKQEDKKPDVNVIRIKDDPRFSTFFKMLAVGVPEPAVKLKMNAAGLDPSLLE